MIKKKVSIVNKLGLHARAAAKFVQKANEFKSHVNVTYDSQTVNGKSIIGILMLAAPVGSELEIEADGSDEGDALLVLAGMIEDGFGEEKIG